MDPVAVLVSSCRRVGPISALTHSQDLEDAAESPVGNATRMVANANQNCRTCARSLGSPDVFIQIFIFYFLHIFQLKFRSGSKEPHDEGTKRGPRGFRKPPFPWAESDWEVLTLATRQLDTWERQSTCQACPPDSSSRHSNRQNLKS